MRARWIVISLVGFTASSATADVDKALLKEPFTATPSELLSAAKSAPAGDWPVGMLRQENHVRFDEQGRAVTRWRAVFVVKSQAGADEWGTLTYGWQPFYQDKPVIRARVIEPGGKVIELDQKLINDAPAVETSPSVFSDRRRIEAPLPRLQIGAVVEQEIVTTDRAPLLAAGTVDLFSVGSTLPIASTQLVFSAPLSRDAKVVGRGLPAGIKPKRVVAAGRETWTYDISSLGPRPEWEPFTPGDVAQFPSLGIATGASWSAVARGYRKLLDQRIVDGPFALPAQLRGSPTIETVRAIVAWMHQQVRYTGIEFGDASNIPWPPAETVKRGFGDCKDKATLLVALLREVGIRADLALLSTGPGRDIDKDLPGMGVFDHAIVRAQIGGRDVWIDATEDLVIVGALPIRDQGRRALIIANDTRDLAMTPRQTAAETVIRQVRTFELAEQGPARVTEVSHEGGSFESDNRGWIRDTRAEEVRKDLVSYVEKEYRAKSLVSFSSSPPTALGTPFELTLVAKDASRAYTGRDRIDVWLFASDTMEKLPELLSTVDDKVTRKHDFDLPRPHTFEIENRLVLPPGYEPPSLTPERVRTLGTMTLTERQRLDGPTVVVTYTLVTGKPRLTPAELLTVQKELRDLEKEESQIVIEHAGWALVERGKPKQAIAEVRRLIALHPKEALHHTQLAFVLLRAGAGAAARAEAQLAVKLEPKSADAQVVLGWTLKHDTLGREYGFDHDRAGAIAAFRAARKLDPKHIGAATDLAEVLERDAKGIPLNDGADLKTAVETWRAAYELEKSSEHGQSLARVLLRSGSGAEAERVARTIEADDTRDALLVAAVAVARGSKAAIGEASTLRIGQARTKMLDAAAAVLMLARRYDLMRELFAHTGSMKTGSPQATMMGALARQSTKPGSSKDPREVFRNFYYSTMFSTPTRHVFWDDATRDELRVPGTHRGTLAQLRQMGGAFVWDLAVSSLKFKAVEGRLKGPWRLEAEVVGQNMVVYVALDRDHAALIGEAAHPAGLGRHALRLLELGDEAGARVVLDWVGRDVAAAKPTDKENHPFLRIWGTGLPVDKDAIAIAAAVVASGTETTVSIPALARCATKVPDGRKSCDLVLAVAYAEAQRWKESEAHMAAWSERDPSAVAKLAPAFRALALAKLGRFDEADAVNDKALATSPDDETLLYTRSELALARGKVDVAIDRLIEIMKRPGNNALAKNNAAWLRVSTGKDLAAALVHAREAVRDAKDSSVLNTLAAVLAEVDDLGAARTEGWSSMDVGGREQPSSADWFVIGRIYEGLGLRADAIAAYKRQSREKLHGFSPTAYDLGRARLAKLGIK